MEPRPQDESRPPATQAHFHPAQPILASTLLSLGQDQAVQQPKRVRIGTSCPAIDDALEGGFDHGRISLISGEPKTGKTTLVLHALATYLVSGPDNAQAAVIDASGEFDVLRFHGIVLARLKAREEATKLRRKANQILDRDWTGAGFAKGGEGNLEEEAARMLDRVKVIRVFDFIGVMEGVGEVRAELEKADSSVASEAESAPNQAWLNEQSRDAKAGKCEVPKAPRTRLEVADSDEEDDGAELLLSGTESIKGLTIDTDNKAQQADADQEEAPAGERSRHAPSKITLLVIDNIATVLAPLMKNNYVHAHTLLTPFMRHLSHLCRQHHLCTIITNNTSSLRGYRDYASNRLARSFPSSTSGSSPADMAPEERAAVEAENPSIFACNAVKPALGGTFAACADLHVLTTRVPLEKKDATMALSSPPEGAVAGGPFMQTATVVEVMTDRYSGRVGRWAAVTIAADGDVKSAV